MKKKNIIILLVILALIFLLPLYINNRYEKEKDKAADVMADFQSGLDYHTKALDKQLENKQEEVIELANKAIEKLPKNLSVKAYSYALSDAYTIRGGAHMELGNYSKAIEDFSKVIEINPNNPRVLSAYNNRAEAKAKMGDYQGAMEDFKNSLAMDPNYGVTYKERGMVKINYGDTKAGCEDLETALINGLHSVESEIQEYCR